MRSSPSFVEGDSVVPRRIPEAGMEEAAEWRCLRTMYIMKFIFKSMLKHSPLMSDEDIIDA